jgi:hypothetical protein
VVSGKEDRYVEEERGYGVLVGKGKKEKTMRKGRSPMTAEDTNGRTFSRRQALGLAGSALAGVGLLSTLPGVARDATAGSLPEEGNMQRFIRTRFTAERYEGGAFSYCSIATNQTNGVVSYAEGILDYSPSSRRFEGVLGHYFSDRTWDDPARFAIEREPFNPARVDRTGVSIQLQDDDQLIVTFTALSWGNAQSTLRIIGCEGDVLYGVGSGIGAQITDALCAISLAIPQPIPG